MAMALYSRAIAKLRDAIGDQTPTLLSTRNRNRGMRAFYQVRIGADTRPAADDSAIASAARAGPALCCETIGREVSFRGLVRGMHIGLPALAHLSRFALRCMPDVRPFA